MTTLAPAPRPESPSASDPTDAVPEATRRRLLPLVPPRDPWSWLVAGVVTAIAAIVRLVHLDRPGHIIFDETYYAPNAYALLEYGVEWEIPEGGATPVDGAPVLGDGPAYVVHPPLGKWLIALGEWGFGYTPFGWRIAAAVAGIVSVLLIVRIGRRLFGSTVLGGLAGLLVALDGMHLVMSRTALLDIFLLFFVVAAFGALLLDRDSRRARWLAALERGQDRPRPARWWQALPWWRFATAALLGCALAVKWSAAFFIPVFLLLMVVWEVGTRRSAGVARPWRDTLRRESGNLLTAAVIVPVVYVASWSGWFATDHGYLRHYPVETRGESLLTQIFGPLRNLFEYHYHALTFHSGLDAEHPYQSEPWQWLLLGRPVAFHWANESGCGADHCGSAVLLLGTPLLWWSFLPALAALLWIGLRWRDWRMPAIGLTAAAGFVPWFFFDDRVMFYFYALPAQPFLVLAVVYVLGAVMRSGTLAAWFGPPWRWLGPTLVTAYLVAVAVTFLYFFPIYTAQVIPLDTWHSRMWLPTWS